MKKLVLLCLIAVACMMPVLVVAEAQAAPTWATVWVNNAGQNGSGKFAVLTDATGTMPTINATSFQFSNSYAPKTLLYTALKSMQSGQKVQVYLSNVVPGSQILALFALDN